MFGLSVSYAKTCGFWPPLIFQGTSQLRAHLSTLQGFQLGCGVKWRRISSWKRWWLVGSLLGCSTFVFCFFSCCNWTYPWVFEGVVNVNHTYIYKYNIDRIWICKNIKTLLLIYTHLQWPSKGDISFLSLWCCNASCWQGDIDLHNKSVCSNVVVVVSCLVVWETNTWHRLRGSHSTMKIGRLGCKLDL